MRSLVPPIARRFDRQHACALEPGAEAPQHAGCNALTLADQAQQDLLRPTQVWPVRRASFTACSITYLARGVRLISPGATLSPRPMMNSTAHARVMVCAGTPHADSVSCAP